VDRSRARNAVVACLMASGLVVAGAGGAIATADPRGGAHTPGVPHSAYSPSGRGPVRSGWSLSRQPQPQLQTPVELSRAAEPVGPSVLDTAAGVALPKAAGVTAPSTLAPALESSGPPEPVGPSVLDTAAGVSLAKAAGVIAPSTLPLVVRTPPLAVGGGAPPPAPPAGTVAPESPGPRTAAAAERPAGRQPWAANAGGDFAVPPSLFRAGYGQYLRTDGPSQVAALALPGVAGILILTGAGGLLGYRQARAGRAGWIRGSTRFMS
jgi:hypothetical protein